MVETITDGGDTQILPVVINKIELRALTGGGDEKNLGMGICTWVQMLMPSLTLKLNWPVLVEGYLT